MVHSAWNSFDTTMSTMTTTSESPGSPDFSANDIGYSINDPKITIVKEVVVDSIIENRTIERHHRNIVQEIREQPIVEVEKIRKTRYVEDPTETIVIEEPTQYENIVRGPQTSQIQQEQVQTDTIRMVERPFDIRRYGNVQQTHKKKSKFF
ncbi:heat-inducible transcription repressor HrcA [Acrasis kona]|uniref:Heat-inducible transcription repressor HrcA n=1 Tax=Acrasis kona TaxID=1008807 RepID=A0AAW2YGZ6_9EUKA